MTDYLRWQDRFSHSLKKNEQDPSSRFFQLATVDEMHEPHNRTVVMRKFVEDESCIYIICDARSAKCQHLAVNPTASVCWYFNDSREQFRFNCRGKVISIEMDHDKVFPYWQNLSEQMKETFFCPSPAKEIFKTSSESIVGLGQAPAHFALIALSVNYIDYLNVSNFPHQRVEYTVGKNYQWEAKRIAP